MSDKKISKEVLEKLNKYKKAFYADYWDFDGKWNGYDIYSPGYNEKAPCIGLQLLGVKNGKVEHFFGEKAEEVYNVLYPSTDEDEEELEDIYS